MQTLRALLAASAIPLSFPLLAQAVTTTVTASTVQQRQFTVGQAIVRLESQGAGLSARVSRDGGRTFQALPPIDDQLYLRIGTFDPMVAPPQLPDPLAAPAGCQLFVVQCVTTILPEYHDGLLAAGLEVIAYFPMNAYVVRGDVRSVAAVQAQPWVRWTGALPIGYRLEEALLERVALAAAAALQPVEYNVVLASKADRPKLAAEIRQLGGEVTNLNGDSVYLQARLTARQLAQVAGLDTVLWIDETTPIGTDMDNARIQGGADYVRTVAGYTGTGVRAEITEGVDQAHPDWVVPVLIRFDRQDSHGHCTASIVGLSGLNNPAATGVMPNCQIIECPNGAWGGTSRYNIIGGSVNPSLQWRAMQQTASWGNTQTTAYTSVSVEMDNALFVFDLPTTQSQSNTNNQNSRPQAWAKNIISVGGLRHGNNADPSDDVWNGASIGPASDGRIKPDICAYYDLILCGDLVGTAGYNTAAAPAGNYYNNFGGTSGATPIVNGYLGLIQEMYTDGLFHNPLPLPATANNRFLNRPHMTTAKVLLTSTAAAYPFSGATANLARTRQGWGFPDVRRLYDNRKKIVVMDEYDVLTQGQSKTWLVWVPPGNADFRAAMSYADPAGVANSTIHRVNSLDLLVAEFGTNNFWWGNNGLLAGNVSTPGGVPNDRDTLEHVYLSNPTPGIYQITVQATAIVQDGHVETPQLDADFALAFHPVGGGYHDDTGMVLDLVSTGPGDLRVELTNVPPSGWVDGFTFFSLNTFGRKGFGPFFGITDDFITAAIFNEPAAAGSPFHFTNSAGVYPFATYAFAPSLALALSGLSVDGMVTLFDANFAIVAQSNVDRVTVQ